MANEFDTLVIREHGAGVAFGVHLQPKASRDQVQGVREGALKVQVTAAPSDNQANKALMVFLARVFGVPKSSVELIAGPASRSKRVAISGIGAQECRQRLVAAHPPR